jgi:hypothetical protein
MQCNYALVASRLYWMFPDDVNAESMAPQPKYKEIDNRSI